MTSHCVIYKSFEDGVTVCSRSLSDPLLVPYDTDDIRTATQVVWADQVEFCKTMKREPQIWTKPEYLSGISKEEADQAKSDLYTRFDKLGSPKKPNLGDGSGFGSGIDFRAETKRLKALLKAAGLE